MPRYAAFLRGINLGARRVKMDELRTAFESLGFSDVKTYIASGNVVFATRAQNGTALKTKIEQNLRTQFGFDVDVIVRTVEELRALARENPFRRVRAAPKTRLYVTFLAQKPRAALTTPYKSPGKEFAIVSVSDREICSAVTLTPGTGTTDLMTFLEKQFGKGITTRSWTTILKLLP